MSGAFTGYPAEMIEDTIEAAGVTFRMGPREPRALNALACAGQVLPLPAGTRRVHLLVAASEENVLAVFGAGSLAHTVTVPVWTGYVGSWDNRVFDGEVSDKTYSVDNPLLRIDAARAPVARPAWWASHHHAKGEDRIYQYCYMFPLSFDVPAGVTTFTLPRDSRIRVFAATAASVDNAGASPLQTPFPELFRDASFAQRFGKP